MGHAKIVELTAENFTNEVLNAHQPTLVDFWSPLCAPCRAMDPLVEAVAETFAEHLAVGKVDVDLNPDLAVRYDVRCLPTLALFSEGTVVRTWVGTQPERRFAHELADAIRHELAKPILRELEQVIPAAEAITR